MGDMTQPVRESKPGSRLAPGGKKTAEPAPKGKAKTAAAGKASADGRRRKLGLAAAEELQATRGLLRETGEAVLVRLDAELAAMASYLRGEELEGERPRLPSPRTLAAMVNACRALKVKPKKGRVKDLARIEALLKALSAMMPPEA